MDREYLLESLKQKIGIDDFESVSDSQFAKIQKLVAGNVISKEEMNLLVEIMPNFVQLQQTYVDGLKTLINAAKENQREALMGISKQLENSIDLLKHIVDKAETEELRFKIADIALQIAKYGVEIAEKLKEVNKDNNSTWKEIGRIASVAFVILGGIFLSNRGNKS